MRRVLCLVLACAFCIVSRGNCGERAEKIKELLASDDYDVQYNISVVPRVKTDEEKKLETIRGQLSSQDQKLAVAVYKAMCYANSFSRNQKITPPLDSLYLLMIYARSSYELHKLNIPFILHIKHLINTKFSNSGKWIRYYKVFME